MVQHGLKSHGNKTDRCLHRQGGITVLPPDTTIRYDFRHFRLEHHHQPKHQKTRTLENVSERRERIEQNGIKDLPEKQPLKIMGPDLTQFL
jgi:hypothetical protein